MAEGDLGRAFAGNLRRIRESRGISQEALGYLIGFHRTYISALERAVKNPSLQTVERLAEKLGVDPLDLLIIEAAQG